MIFDPKEELRKRRTSNAELGKEFRQDVGNEVNGEVADHVRAQVAPPKVKASEDRTEREREQNVGRADSCCEMKADWITIVTLVNERFLVTVGALLLAVNGLHGGEYQRTKDGTLVWNNDPKPEDAADWSGERDKDGYATGKGTLVWYRTERGSRTGSNIPSDKHVPISSYSGKMVRGKLNGPVAAADANGKIFHGTFANGRRTRDWVAGAPRVRRGELVEAPAPAEGPPGTKPQTVQTPPAPPTQDQGQQPLVKTAPKPGQSGGSPQVSDSLRSLTAPPASLRTELAAAPSPPASMPASEQPPAPPAAKTGLSAVEVIELADAEARGRGYNLDEYRRPQVQYDTERETWSLSYEDKGATGKHFSVAIDEKTRKAELKK